jgi:hypothetical protein
MRHIAILIALPVLLLLISCINFGMDNNNKIHTRNGFFPEYKEYKFNDQKKSKELITSFSLNEIDDSVFRASLINWQIDYFIFTTVEEAEFAMVERLAMINVIMDNAIDHPIDKYSIGDNCWHQLPLGAIKFLRNNILVMISPELENKSFDLVELKNVAFTIDSVLINKAKVIDGRLIDAPVIRSTELIPVPPFALNDRIEIKITVDNLSQSNYYRIYGTGFASISYDGNLKIRIDDYYLINQGSKKHLMIWIWNDDYKTTSTLIEIPLKN